MPDITLNGQPIKITERCSLAEALTQWNTPPHFAIAVNRTFVARQAYSAVTLREGDCVDWIVPMQGG